MAEQEALDESAEDGDREGRAEGGDPESPGPRPQPLDELVGGVGAQHVEGPVGEVQHAQDAEDEREPRRDQEEKHGGRQAGKALREDERRIGHEAQRGPAGGRPGALAVRGVRAQRVPRAPSGRTGAASP